MKKLMLIGSFLFLLTGLLRAQDLQIEFEEYDLENGLHVILHQDSSTPIVAVTVMYHVGSKNENPDRTGFAHFFEHLMFEGTENIGRHEYSEYVERAGGVLNANTTADRTFYYELLPSNQLELGLWLESERMLHAKVESIGIETQRSVVKEERRQRYENTPYGSIMVETMKRAFKEHPYRWTTIGAMEHIDAATDEEFQEFYETFYVPNNAVLCIAGDIDIEETKKQVEKYFAEIPAGENEIPRPDVVEPPQTEEIRDTVFDNIQLPAVIQAYRTPQPGTKEYYAVDMLSKLLSQGESSRLNKVLVEDKQLAMNVFMFPLPYEDPSLAMTFAIPTIGVEPNVMEEAINKEVERLQTELISDRELQKIKNQIAKEVVTQNRSIAARAGNLATFHTFYGDANLINTEVDNYMEITKEDLREAAKKYFVPTNRVVLYYLPHQQQK